MVVPRATAKTGYGIVSQGIHDAAPATSTASGDPIISARKVPLSCAEGTSVNAPRTMRPSRTNAKKNTTQNGIASGSLKISARCKLILRDLTLNWDDSFAP